MKASKRVCKPCAYCGKLLYRTPYHAKLKNWFCSRNCQAKWQAENWKGYLNKGRILSKETRKKLSNSIKSSFANGRIAWNKDKVFSLDARKKMSLTKKKLFAEGKLMPWNKNKTGLQKAWNKGQRQSEETKKKLSETRKKLFAESKIILWNKGQKGLQKAWNKEIPCREETKRKLSSRMKGRYAMEKNHSWLGGVSFEPYGIEFNNKRKEQIRQRDNYHCQRCFKYQEELRDGANKPYKLLIHHIDYNKRNNNTKNLISLCRPCHLQTNFDRTSWAHYFREIILTSAQACEAQSF